MTRIFLLHASARLAKDPPTNCGPFVYRLGHLVFNQVRGVRLPYGLPLIIVSHWDHWPLSHALSNTLGKLDTLPSFANPLSASFVRFDLRVQTAACLVSVWAK